MKVATELSRPGLSPTVPMPRIRAEAFDSLPVDDTSSDGASWLSWRMSLAPEFCSCACVTALTAIGTSLSGLARRVAVTTMSPAVVESASEIAGSPALGDCDWTAALAVLDVGTCCSAAVPGTSCWAAAGAAIAMVATADSKVAVRRMVASLPYFLNIRFGPLVGSGTGERLSVSKIGTAFRRV